VLARGGFDAMLTTPAWEAWKPQAKEFFADLIDCESHALSAWAARSGAAWGIVRGVSDGPRDELPRQLSAWINPGGKPRALRIARDLLLHPALIPRVRTIRDQSTRAMAAAAHGLDRLLDMIAATTPAGQSAPAPRIGPAPIDPAARAVLIFGGSFDPPHRAHVEQRGVQRVRRRR